MSLERLSSGTTRNHVHHGGFDFQEAQVIQISSDTLDDLSSGLEDFSGSVVHDKIQISLSISSFLVGETSVFSGQHVQAVREDSDGSGGNGEFTSAGSDGLTVDTNDITSSDHGVNSFEIITLMFVGSSKDLDSGTITLQVVENKLVTGRSDVSDTTYDKMVNMGMFGREGKSGSRGFFEKSREERDAKLKFYS